MKLIRIIFILFFSFGMAQNDNKEELIAATVSSCECIATIALDNDDKNTEVKNCIESSLEKIEVEEEQIGVYYKKVEGYLIQQCDALKQLAFAENKKFKHASSENVLAQLAYDDGMDYMNSGDLENAIAKFSKAVEIDPKFAFAWDNLGISYRKNKEYEKAIQAYQNSLAIYDAGRLPLLNIAITYNLNKQYHEAIFYYKKFIEEYEEDPEGYYGLGLILYTQDQQEEGLDNLIHAYTIYTAQNSPYRADAAKKIGYMYKDLKNQNKLDIFQKVADKYNLKVQNN